MDRSPAPPRGRDSSPDEDDEDLRSRLGGADAFELLVEVAHDLRSPLTSILFLTEALRNGLSGELNELQRSQLGLVYGAAFGLASLVSDMLDLAGREEDVIGRDPRPYAVGEVFETIRRLVTPIVEEKGLELRIVVPPRLEAEGHPQAIGRVLLNLTTNALKFTDTGHVEIGAQRMEHDGLEYYVQDTGRGIPPERMDELFKPFKRRLGDPGQGHFFSGSGIGLGIARRLVRAMGSELAVSSSDQTGTRFSFTLPTTDMR